MSISLGQLHHEHPARRCSTVRSAPLAQGAPQPMAQGIPKETRFLQHAEKTVSSNAFVCCQKRNAEGLREGFQAVRSTGRQIPHVPFRLQLLGQGEGSAGGSGRWERAEPWAAIKHKSRTQEVTSVVGTSVLASLSSLCLRSDCLEVALAEANTTLINLCRGASPLQRQTLFPQAT